MSTIAQPAGPRITLTTTALNSLASATYVNAGIIDVYDAAPLDIIIEVEATPGTVSNDKALYVFCKISMDSTDYSTGPESGTTTTDEPNLYLIGVLPLNTNSTRQLRGLSLVSALGFIPPYFKVIVKNSTGAALAASGHAIHYTTINGSVG